MHLLHSTAICLEFSLIIPTFNEQDLIRDSITQIFHNLKASNITAELLVVDDSTDDTAKILQDLSKKHTNLRVIHRTNSRGVGSAIRLGIDSASGKYAVVFMSDAPHDIKYIPSILEKLNQGYDLVHTSRFMKGSQIIGYPLTKKIANRSANWCIRLAFFRFDLKDYTSLFKGFNVASIRRLNLEGNEFDVGCEISMKSIKKGLKIVEVPVSWKEREIGKSKLRLSKQGPNFFNRCMKVWLFYW